SKEQQPIQDVFAKINERINAERARLPEEISIEELKHRVPYVGELYLGHVRYGTFGKNSIESVHPFLRQNNWMHRNLILAGNFNMTNVPQQFQYLVDLGQHPKEKSDTVTVLEKIGHFLDSEVEKLYDDLKEEEINK